MAQPAPILQDRPRELGEYFDASPLWLALALLVALAGLALVFWRLLLACLILFPFALPHLRRDLPAASKKWKWIFFFGVTGVAGFPIFGYLGLKYTTAINAAVLNSSLPLFMVPTAWLVRGDTIRARQLAGMALSSTPPSPSDTASTCGWFGSIVMTTSACGTACIMRRLEASRIFCLILPFI